MKKSLLFNRWLPLSLLLALFLTFSGTGQTVLFTENWESAAISQTPPAGWAVDLVSGTNYTHFLFSGTSPTCFPFEGNRMVEFKSATSVSGTSNRLRKTIPVQTTGYNFVSVDFQWYSCSTYPYNDDQVIVQWSTNGTAWTSAGTIYRYSQFNNWQLQQIALPAAAANQPALYIAFLFTSYHGQSCHLDLVHINGYTSVPPVPTITTNPVLLVGAKYAYPSGSVNANGNQANAAFEYGLTTFYGSDQSAGIVTGNAPTPVTAFLYPLVPGHQYHCRGIATNVAGTGYGNDVTFTTADTLPEVFTYGSYSITGSGATIQGLVYPNGSNTTIHFNYGLTTAYGSTIAGNPPTAPEDSIQMSTFAVLTGLTPNTTYHYRITGTNSSGTAYGLDSTFTTSGNLPPTVITNQASAITSIGATLNGHVNANGAATTVSFQYGISTSYGSTATYGTVSGSSMTPVSKTISGLLAGTTYHFRTVGTNINGTVYGNDSIFTTLPTTPPTVTTNGATAVTTSGATLNCHVNPNAATTTVSFEYGLTSSYGSTISCGNFNGIYSIPISQNISGLLPATLYHFRAKGVSAAGTAYGSDSVFTTEPLNLPPYVITDMASSITPTSATFNGQVNANGTPTTVTFEYGLTSGYGNTISYGTVTDTTYIPVSAPVTGLTPSTLYHVRIKGVNSFGTRYGSDTTFTTSASGTPLPTVITTGAFYITASNADLGAQVNPNGYATTVSFQYGTTSSYGSTIPYGTVYGNSLTSVYSQAPDLTPATLYHYRVVGTNAGGTSYGDDSTFITNDSLPAAVTLPATDVGRYSVILHGTVQPFGTPANVIFEYGLSEAYGYNIAGTPNVASGNYFHPVMGVINGLLPNTTYHYRIKAFNALGQTTGADLTFTTADSTLCEAQFVYSSDSANPYTIHFQDQTLGNIASWYWDFGDGTPGSTIQNPTHTYQGTALTHTVCLEVQGVDTNCHSFNCKPVTINPATNCQAYFAYSADSTSGVWGYSFTDLSAANPAPNSWLWNFGDPASGVTNVSTLQNAIHYYTSQGTYQVCLTISNGSCTDTYCKIVTVQDSTSSDQINGHVFADGLPVWTGVVNIFSLDTIAPYTPYTAATVIDSAGFYSFSMIPQGDYYLNAIPIGVPGYLPTFYGDVLFWEDATVIHLGTPANPYNINLLSSPNMPTGNGSINGQINITGLKSGYVEKITMLLTNNTGITKFVVVDPTGGFSFSSLAYGVYFLKAEMAGISSDMIKVIIHAGNANPEVTMTFNGTKITSTDEHVNVIQSWFVYPNPLSEQSYIYLKLAKPMVTRISITNLTGEVLQTGDHSLMEGENRVSFLTSSLSPGIYFLRIQTDEGVSYITKIIKAK